MSSPARNLRFNFAGLSSESLTTIGNDDYEIMFGGVGSLLLSMQGSGHVMVRSNGAGSCVIDRVGNGPLTVQDSGAGSITIYGDGTGPMQIVQSGAGAVAAVHNGTDDIEIVSSGAGSVRLDNFNTARVYISASGMGTISIYGDAAQNSIRSHTGFGHIYYGDEEIERPGLRSTQSFAVPQLPQGGYGVMNYFHGNIYQINCNYQILQNRAGYTTFGFDNVYYEVPSSGPLIMAGEKVYFNGLEFEDFEALKAYVVRVGERLGAAPRDLIV